MNVWWRRKTVLAGAIAAAALVGVFIWPGLNRTAELAPGSSNRTGQGGGPLPDVPVVDLRLERLQAEHDELAEADRNPFRFRPKPPPPPPPRAAVRPAPPPEAFTAPPPGPPPVPAIPVKYMGITVSRGQRVAHFTDTRGAVFSGKEGDIIEGRYRVLRVGMDSVELAYVDGRGRQTIRMTGQ
jgi:hypothetical protein